MYANYYITSYDYVIYAVAIQVNGKLVIIRWSPIAVDILVDVISKWQLYLGDNPPKLVVSLPWLFATL